MPEAAPGTRRIRVDEHIEIEPMASRASSLAGASLPPTSRDSVMTFYDG
jgi:hypothetical protein